MRVLALETTIQLQSKLGLRLFMPASFYRAEAVAPDEKLTFILYKRAKLKNKTAKQFKGCLLGLILGWNFELNFFLILYFEILHPSLYSILLIYSMSKRFASM